jgi:hypothetical protein
LERRPNPPSLLPISIAKEASMFRSMKVRIKGGYGLVRVSRSKGVRSMMYLYECRAWLKDLSEHPFSAIEPLVRRWVGPLEEVEGILQAERSCLSRTIVPATDVGVMLIWASDRGYAYDGIRKRLKEFSSWIPGKRVPLSYFDVCDQATYGEVENRIFEQEEKIRCAEGARKEARAQARRKERERQHREKEQERRRRFGKATCDSWWDSFPLNGLSLGDIGECVRRELALPRGTPLSFEEGCFFEVDDLLFPLENQGDNCWMDDV